ncbi:MAG TPA: YceI family protein [Burkholderiaceae bacterium]|jgi:polyisoprenoid-binding protein YceI
MSSYRKAAVFTVLVIASRFVLAAPVNYTISSKLSRVTFSIEHQGFIESFGTLKISPGAFVFDNDDWPKSSVAVSMPTKTLDMGDGLWNKQIRGDLNWKNLFNHPSIAFRSTRIEQMDETHGTLQGELTLAGITKPVALQLQVNKIGVNAVSERPAVGFTATGTVKRSQFGLDAYEDLVGDDLKIQVQLEAWVGPDPDAHKN